MGAHSGSEPLQGLVFHEFLFLRAAQRGIQGPRALRKYKWRAQTLARACQGAEHIGWGVQTFILFSGLPPFLVSWDKEG